MAHDDEYDSLVNTIVGGDPNDDDGRSGMAWVHDYQDEWKIEDEQIIVLGPVQIDIVDKKEYGKIHIEDYKPTTEENE